ncbi:MAG TPA: alpha/beta hydrolase [Pirellulales bacterium]|nr:alpha/beta hydrolase [Pirellulales bacterium]
MSDTIRILSGTLVLLSFAAPLRAETVSATGIMESVDATAGTITVRRKTATGEKSAQFKITRATKVLFDGAVSGLHQFAVGQKVSIVYDTKAKQVTKLEAWSWNAGSPSTAGQAVPQFNRDLPYAEPSDQLQTLDIYAPPNADKLPVILWIHGGGWQTGDKSEVNGKPGAFNEKRFIFVSMNYRLMPAVEMAAIVGDVAKSIRWVHDHVAQYGGAPERLFVMGHSAGAQLAALVCTDERYLKAEGLSLAIIKGCVPVDGDTYDVPLIIETAARRRRALGQPEPIFGHDQKFGGNPAKHRDFSAVNHVARDKGIPPFLLLHVADNVDTTAQAGRLASALTNAGAFVQVFGAKATDHRRIDANLGLANDPSTEAVFQFLMNRPTLRVTK